MHCTHKKHRHIFTIPERYLRHLLNRIKLLQSACHAFPSARIICFFDVQHIVMRFKMELIHLCAWKIFVATEYSSIFDWKSFVFDLIYDILTLGFYASDNILCCLQKKKNVWNHFFFSANYNAYKCFGNELFISKQFKWNVQQLSISNDSQFVNKSIAQNVKKPPNHFKEIQHVLKQKYWIKNSIDVNTALLGGNFRNFWVFPHK